MATIDTDTITKYIPVVVIIAGFAVTWGSFVQRMEALEETIVRIEEKQLDVDVAVKQEQIKQLRSDMNELEDKYRTQWQIYGKLENDLRSHLNNH
jgi:septal ring factor EnvC (AmiA/AmiB activator)